jgi:hypothetical protein
MKKARTAILDHRLVRLASKSGIRKHYDTVVNFLSSPKESRLFNLSLVLLVAVFYTLRGARYITRPQLFAEDGELWLSGAYNKGIRTVFESYNGLSHLFDRLFGLLAVHIIPLKYEPVFFVLTGLVIFLLLFYYLLSGRTGILSNNYQKLFLALSLCLLGNAEEFYFSFSNSVFLLGVIGLFLLVQHKSRHKTIDVLEKILFFILCFSNVFAWIYLLILAFEFIWKKRRRYFYAVCAVAGSVVQLLSYTNQGAAQRPSVPLRFIFSKATAFEFYNQIIIPSLRFGRQDISPTFRTTTDLVLVCFSLLVTGIIVALVFWKSNYKTKCLLFFCIVMTLISLKSPIDGQTSPSAIVIVMATYHWGNRYFIFGILGLFIIWAKFSQKLISKRYLPMFLLVFFVFGLLSSISLGSFFIHKDFINLTSQYSNGIAEVKHSTKPVVIPINPVGWYVTLNPK